MKLCEKIVELRKVNNMSQEVLAEQLNISRQAVSRWEMGTAMPDANNILQLSELFNVTTDYLLNDSYISDNDVPKIKEKNKILQMNLSLIAIILQTAFLNVAMRPFQEVQTPTMRTIELIIKIIPLLGASIWMMHNLKFEENKDQYKNNTKIELVYCLVQVGIFLFGYISKYYWIATPLLLATCLVYIFIINPKYMNRKMTK